MSELMKEQTKLVTKQSETICSKEEQLKIAYDNIRLQRLRLEDLENKSMSAPDDLKIKHIMESDLKAITFQLEREKENISIKDKIIESHLQTIGQMKTTLLDKESDVSSLKRRISETEKELSVERTKNDQLLSKVKVLQTKKEELKTRVEELEEELDTQLASDHTTRLEQLEKQIRDKHKAWEEQKRALENEKEEVVQIIRSTTQQLADKRSECERLEAAHQRLVDDLTCRLRDQEQSLTQANRQVADLTSELEGAAERAASLRKRFDDRLRVLCDTWHKAIQGLEGLDSAD